MSHGDPFATILQAHHVFSTGQHVLLVSALWQFSVARNLSQILVTGHVGAAMPYQSILYLVSIDFVQRLVVVLIFETMFLLLGTCLLRKFFSTVSGSSGSFISLTNLQNKRKECVSLIRVYTRRFFRGRSAMPFVGRSFIIVGIVLFDFL